jgi:hydrogenase large subunit
MQSFEFQRKAAQVVAMLGGKTPHIQNLAVGGVANAINLDSVAVLGIERLAAMRALMHEFSEFVQNVYFADACVLASAYPDWFDIGRGTDEYLAVPDLAKDSRTGRFDLPGGYWRGPLHVSEDQVSAFSKSSFIDAVSEDISHAYYRGDKSQHPWKGNTTPAYTDWQPENKYTWVKAARYEGRPAEVGPLAQVLIGYKQGHALTRKWTDAALERVSAGAGRRIGVDQLRSTMGRHLARAIRAAMLTELAEEYWQLFAENVASGDTTVQTPFDIPNNEVRGVGIHEAPRGALSHWVVIDKGRIANYQAMVPSTWNAGPRDDKGQRSPYEAALLGTPVADAERPLETIRTIHSFDPCMACACHTFDLSGKKLGEVKAL